jgi:large subunit ribosomal protein L30
MSAAKKKDRRLRITLTKSPIGYSYRQKRTVRALGLRRMHQTVEQNDTPVIRGMIAKVEHLVTVEELK